MKKFFRFELRKVRSCSVFGKTPQSDGLVGQPWTGEGVSLESGYHIQDRDLQKIHKAACIGDVSEVQRLLSLHPERLNDRDRKKRTALHLACAFGHAEVVTLLAEKKCQMNVGDNRNRTALMKAVECQEEECVTILLKHGADPHMKDFRSNTALHYAAMGHNTAIAEQLLRHQADMEATNEFDFTPLLFAVHQKSQKMVEFLLERHANIHAVDKWKRTALMLAVKAKSSDTIRLLLQAGADVFAQDDSGWTAEEYALSKGLKDNAKLISDCKEERRWKKSSDNNSRVDECSKCDPASSLSRKPGSNDSWAVSKEWLVDVDTKTSIEVEDPGPHEAVEMDDVQPFRPDSSSWNATSLTLNHGTSQRSGDSKFGDERPFATHSTSKPLSASTEFGQMAIIDKRKTQIAVDECSKCDPASSLSCETGNMDSWSVSEEWLFEVDTKKEATKPSIRKRENRVAIIESAPQDQINNDNLTCVDRAHQDNISVKTSLGVGQDEDEESPWDSETSIEVEDPVPNEAVEMDDVQPFRPASSKWNATSLTFKHGTCQRSGDWNVGDKRPFASHSMSKPLSASTEFGQMTVTDKRKTQIVERPLGMTSEEGKARLDGNEKNYTRVVQEENDTQRPFCGEQDDRILQDAILTNHLCKQKETEINLKKMNSEVSESYEKEKDLLRENHMLRDEIAILRLQMDTLKTQNQGTEKKYFEDTANVKEKNDRLQKTIKQNDNTLTKTVFEYNRQLNVPTPENTMLNSQLENDRRSKERLKIEAESDLYMLASASLHHYELCKQLIRHLQNAFQGSREECLHFMDKIKFARRNLKENTEILSQQLSKARSKSNSLDTELPHTRYAVRERTLVFEPVLKDLNQTQCQEEEIEHMYQRERGKVNTHTGELEYLKEKGSDLQSGNMLLRRQLDDAFKKSDNENSGMNIEEQLQQLKKVLQAIFEKQDRMLKERHQDFVNKLNHLNRRICQYEKDKSEKEVVGRQLQRELPDTIKKLPTSEASLEVRSHYSMNSQAETRDFKTLEQLRSQLQEARPPRAEDAKCTEKMQDHVQKLETKNAVLRTIVKKLEGLIEHLQRNLSGTSLSQDGKEQLEYYKKLTESLQCNLNQQKKTNDGLEKEVTRLKTLFQNTRMLHDNQNGEEQASPENVDPLNDRGDASISDVEVRIQRLKSELSEVKTLKVELEEYKRLYLEALNLRTSLENELNKTNDRLAEMRTQLLMKAPQNTLLSTAPRRPDLHLSCVGRLNDWFRPRGNLAPREQLVIATSAPQTSNNGTWTNLMKEQQELVKA